MAVPLMASAARISSRSSTSSMRQKPTRLPYSCHAQFGMSGIGEPPAGGVSTVRGIGWWMSHSSTLTIVQTARRAPPGSLSGGRSEIGEYWIRSVGSMEISPARIGNGGHESLAGREQALLELAEARVGENQLAMALERLPGDEHRVDVRLLGVSHDDVGRVAAGERRKYRRAVAADDDEVGLLADRERADL